MAEQVRIRIDLSAGAVEVDAPLEALDSVFARLETFLPQLSGSARLPTSRNTVPPGADSRDPATNDAASEADAGGVGSTQGGRKRAASKAKETYKIAKLNMDEAKREEFRSFFSTKDPKGQNDQTLVIMYGLKTMASVQTPTKDEIFSGFRLLPDVKVPGKISSVLGNLVGGGFVTNVALGTYELTHVGEDRVKLELPQKNSAKR